MPQQSKTSSDSDPPPFPLPPNVDQWIDETLVKGVFESNIDPLKQAVESAKSYDIPQMSDWGVVDDQTFLLFASGMLNWIPSETCNGKLIYNTLCLFYFILDQPSLNIPRFSTQICPDSVGQPLAPLSQWTVDFANKIGDWMNKSGSITEEAIQSFQNSPKYNYGEAEVPAKGWQNFNQLFARYLKKGMRPISAGNPTDANYDRVVVYPADSTFDGAWPIDQNDQVTIKDLQWNISDLLQKSEYASCFNGGTWMHAFLNTFDYHRQHAPVGGKVVEANVIQGLAYLQVVADPETGKLKPHRSYVSKEPKQSRTENQLFDTLDAPDEAGYQFLQARGCVISKQLWDIILTPFGIYFSHLYPVPQRFYQAAGFETSYGHTVAYFSLHLYYTTSTVL